jgi:hypothetical protein
MGEFVMSDYLENIGEAEAEAYREIFEEARENEDHQRQWEEEMFRKERKSVIINPTENHTVSGQTFHPQVDGDHKL